jgi:hypothetical protein
MKKVFSLILVMIVGNCNAQQLSYKQLVQLSRYSSFEQSNEYLEVNHYFLKDSVVKGSLINFIWEKGKASSDSNDSLKTATWMQIPALFTITTATTGTCIKSEALAFINELAAEGFTIENTSASENTVTTKFKNSNLNNIQVELISNTQTINGLTSIYWYTFKIMQ